MYKRQGEKQGVCKIKGHRKNNKAPVIAVIENGEITCPKCGALLGKAYYGAKCCNVELWCRGKECRMPVFVEI